MGIHGAGAGGDAASTPLQLATDALRKGQCVAVLDDEEREGETDLFYPAAALQPQDLRFLRLQAGGELYIAVGAEVAYTFGLPHIGEVLREPELSGKYPVLGGLSKLEGAMCQGPCSVGLSLDHRSTKTGAPDKERSLTCRRVAELWREVRQEGASREEALKRLGEEFHTPGHIFLCVEHGGGLQARGGHTELSVALARMAGITPAMVGCVMLSNAGGDYGALAPSKARNWAKENKVPFLTGKDIIGAHSGGADNGSKANGVAHGEQRTAATPEVHGNGTVAEKRSHPSPVAFPGAT